MKNGNRNLTIIFFHGKNHVSKNIIIRMKLREPLEKTTF